MGKIDIKVWFALGGIVVALFVVMIGLYSLSNRDAAGGRYPQVGDHWHADYTITICGEQEPIYPFSEGGVHTHGDGRMHIHPTHAGEAGLNANVARFLASTGSRITDESIRIPTGDEYANGDPCPDSGPGKLVLRVNGIASPDIASYVPRDGDVVDISFEAE